MLGHLCPRRRRNHGGPCGDVHRPDAVAASAHNVQHCSSERRGGRRRLDAGAAAGRLPSCRADMRRAPHSPQLPAHHAHAGPLYCRHTHAPLPPAPSLLVWTGTDMARMALASPATSSAVSPLARSSTRNAAICAGSAPATSVCSAPLVTSSLRSCRSSSCSSICGLVAGMAAAWRAQG